MKHVAPRVLALLALATAVSLALPARAASTVYPSLRLEPATEAEGIGSTEWAGVPDQWGWDAGLVLGYEHLPLYSVSPTSLKLDTLVADRFTADAIADIALLNWVQLGVDVPFVLSQTGDNLSGAGLGDARIIPKVRLMRQQDGAPLDIALFFPFTLPTGQLTPYTGESATTITPGIAVSRTWGKLRLALNLGHRFRQEVTIHDLNLGDEAIYRGGVAYGFDVVDGHPLEVGFSFSGATDTSEIFNQPALTEFVGVGGLAPSPHHVELLLTAKMKAFGPVDAFVGVGHVFGIGSDAAPSITSGYGVPDWRALIGIRASERPAYDYDGDGLTGSADRCPKIAGPAENKGCPDVDTDTDGIVDRLDKCPSAAEDKDGYEDDDGCPDTDNDKDGVLDKDDQCPDSAGPVENKGCPDKDADNDGIIDRKDKCPNEAEDKDGFEDEDGCPDPDNDKDGLADADDQCPNEAGPKGNHGCPDKDRDGDTVVDRFDNCPDEAGSPENGGCPKKQLVVITEAKLEIKDKVYFDTDKDTIQQKSFPLLDNVAAVLKAHPEIKHVRVEGHTDDRGTDEHNMDLSKRRAKSVMKYLVDKGGIDPARLTSEGYGRSRPVASNETKEGKAQNRRVEFLILNDDGSAPAPTTPPPAPEPAPKK